MNMALCELPHEVEILRPLGPHDGARGGPRLWAVSSVTRTRVEPLEAAAGRGPGDGPYTDAFFFLDRTEIRGTDRIRFRGRVFADLDVASLPRPADMKIVCGRELR